MSYSVSQNLWQPTLDQAVFDHFFGEFFFIEVQHRNVYHEPFAIYPEKACLNFVKMTFHVFRCTFRTRFNLNENLFYQTVLSLPTINVFIVFFFYNSSQLKISTWKLLKRWKQEQIQCNRSAKDNVKNKEKYEMLRIFFIRIYKSKLHDNK